MLSDSKSKELLYYLKLPRYIEERMLLLLRQGKISKWFSGIGQEAISVGTTYALEKDDYIAVESNTLDNNVENNETRNKKEREPVEQNHAEEEKSTDHENERNTNDVKSSNTFPKFFLFCICLCAFGASSNENLLSIIGCKSFSLTSLIKLPIDLLTFHS